MNEGEWIDRVESLALTIQDIGHSHGCGFDGCSVCKMVASTGEALEHYAEAMRAKLALSEGREGGGTRPAPLSATDPFLPVPTDGQVVS